MADKKILSIQDGLSGNLPDITTAKAGRILITTDKGEMYYEPEDKKRVKINDIDQTYSSTSENAQSGKAVAEAVELKADKIEVNKLKDDLANLDKSIKITDDSAGNVIISLGVSE